MKETTLYVAGCLSEQRLFVLRPHLVFIIFYYFVMFCTYGLNSNKFCPWGWGRHLELSGSFSVCVIIPNYRVFSWGRTQFAARETLSAVLFTYNGVYNNVRNNFIFNKKSTIILNAKQRILLELYNIIYKFLTWSIKIYLKEVHFG